MQIVPIRPYKVSQQQEQQNTNFKAIKSIKFRKGVPTNDKMNILKMFEHPEIKKMFENWNVDLDILGIGEIRMFVDTKFGNHEFRFHAFKDRYYYKDKLAELEEGLKKGYERISYSRIK